MIRRKTLIKSVYNIFAIDIFKPSTEPTELPPPFL